jgi:MFS family permease
MLLYKIWTYLTKSLSEEQKDDISSGILAGISIGILAGISSGITIGISIGILNVTSFIAGIIMGILAGIIMGILAGIGIGIIAGITTGIIAGIIAGIGDYIVSIHTNSELVFVGVVLLIITEIVFLKFDSKTPEPNQSKIQFTLERKALAILESTIIIGSIIGMYRSISIVSPYVAWLKSYGATGLNFIGWGTTIILIFYGYIWLNSLKYKLSEKKIRGKEIIEEDNQ